MTLQQLRYLLAVAEHGTITAAASALYVAQPALSRALRALERELHLELLTRSGGGVRFTPAGNQIVRLARQMFDIVATIEDVALAASSKSGDLWIAATPSLGIDLTCRILPDFTAKYPKIRPQLARCDSREAVFDALRTAVAALGFVHLPAPADMMAHRLGPREIVLVTPPTTRMQDPVPLQCLDGLPLVMPRRGSELRTELDAMCVLLDIRPVPILETDERSAWLACVLTGQGSMLWYRDLADRVLGDAVAIHSFEPRLYREIALVRPWRALSPQACAFEAFVCGAHPFAGKRQLLAGDR